MRYYAGIGSRETPKIVCDKMSQLATKLEELGFCLRSGNADGADQAFARGVEKAAEIHIPWRSFNAGFQLVKFKHEYIIQDKEDKEAFASVEQFHPNGAKLKDTVKILMARNYRQIIGKDGVNSSFVVAWTIDGKDTGGTGQALRIAAYYNIPIFNLFLPKDLDRIEKFIEKS